MALSVSLYHVLTIPRFTAAKLQRYLFDNLKTKIAAKCILSAATSPPER